MNFWLGRVNGLPVVKELKDARIEGSQKFTELIIPKKLLLTIEIKIICDPLTLVKAFFHMNDKQGSALLNYFEDNIKQPAIKLRLVV